MINTENYVNSSDNLKLGLIDNIENYANNSNTIKTIKDKDVEMTNEEILKEGRQLIDNPSDITLNINDFLEQQEEHLKIFNSNIPKNNNETEDNLELERKLKYPINSPNCPVYLRYMNILKNDYSNYSNNDLLNLYQYSHENKVRIRKRDLLKIATVDGKINCGIDF